MKSHVSEVATLAPTYNIALDKAVGRSKYNDLRPDKPYEILCVGGRYARSDLQYFVIRSNRNDISTNQTRYI